MFKKFLLEKIVFELHSLYHDINYVHDIPHLLPRSTFNTILFPDYRHLNSLFGYNIQSANFWPMSQYKGNPLEKHSPALLS